MKVINPPWVMKTKSVLDAERINDNMTHIAALIQQALDRRFCHDVMLLRYGNITNASTTSERTLSFKPTMTTLIDSIQFYYAGSGSSDVTLTLYINGVQQDLSVVITPNASLTSKIDGRSFVANAGDVVAFVVTGSSFVAANCYVAIGIKTDRHNPLGTLLASSFTPSLYRYNTLVNAITLQFVDFANITTAVTNVVANTKGQRVESYTWKGITSASSINIRNRRVMSVDSDLLTRKIDAARLSVDVNVSTGCSVDISLIHSSGSPTVFSTTLTITAGNSSGSLDISPLISSLAAATYDQHSSAQDFILSINMVTAAVTINKAQCTLVYV